MLMCNFDFTLNTIDFEVDSVYINIICRPQNRFIYSFLLAPFHNYFIALLVHVQEQAQSESTNAPTTSVYPPVKIDMKEMMRININHTVLYMINNRILYQQIADREGGSIVMCA